MSSRSSKANLAPASPAQDSRAPAPKGGRDAPPANKGRHAAPATTGRDDDPSKPKGERDAPPANAGRHAAPATPGREDDPAVPQELLPPNPLDVFARSGYRPPHLRLQVPTCSITNSAAPLEPLPPDPPEVFARSGYRPPHLRQQVPKHPTANSSQLAIKTNRSDRPNSGVATLNSREAESSKATPANPGGDVDSAIVKTSAPSRYWEGPNSRCNGSEEHPKAGEETQAINHTSAVRPLRDPDKTPTAEVSTQQRGVDQLLSSRFPSPSDSQPPQAAGNDLGILSSYSAMKSRTSSDLRGLQVPPAPRLGPPDQWHTNANDEIALERSKDLSETRDSNSSDSQYPKNLNSYDPRPPHSVNRQLYHT